MDYSTFAADLPRDNKISFTSLEENEEELRRLGVKQEMRQLGLGNYRCDFSVRSMESCEFVSDRFNKSLFMHLEPPSGTVGFLFPRSISGEFLASGENVGNDKLLFFPNASDADITIPSLAGSDSFLIPEQRFIEMSEALCPAMSKPESMVSIGGNTVILDKLRRLAVNLMAKRQPDPRGEVQLLLIESAVAFMGHATSSGFDGGKIVSAERIRVARRTREFIEENHHKTFRLEDVCRFTGTGLRSLQRAFHEYFDITITQYLSAVRLDAAYRMLASADSSCESVTRIASAHGFTHFGRFSVAFRQRFGESPRKTLARYKHSFATGPKH